MFTYRMGNRSTPWVKWLGIVFAALFVPAFLLMAYWQNPVLSHDVAEMFSVIVACGVFMLTWNARDFIDNRYFIFLGSAYLFVGGIDYLHSLTFAGVFSSERHSSSIELWFASRFLQSFALLAAPLFVSRKTRPVIFLAGFSAAAFALLGMVYYDIFPDYYVPGKGLTASKYLSDYIIAGMQILSIGTLWLVRDRFDREVFRLLVVSIVFSIASVLSSAMYTDAFVYNSVVGHSLQVVSFYLVYRAVIETGLVRPYGLLFRNLRRAKEETRAAREWLEMRVVERTEELREVNARLEEELSERRRSEEALRESEDRFRTLVENTLVGTMIAHEGRIVSWNKELERILGSITEEANSALSGKSIPRTTGNSNGSATSCGTASRSAGGWNCGSHSRRPGRDDTTSGGSTAWRFRSTSGERIHPRQHCGCHTHQGTRADPLLPRKIRLRRTGLRRDRPRDPEPRSRDQHQHLFPGPAMPAGGGDGLGGQGEDTGDRRAGESLLGEDLLGHQPDHGDLPAGSPEDGGKKIDYPPRRPGCVRRVEYRRREEPRRGPGASLPGTALHPRGPRSHGPGSP